MLIGFPIINYKFREDKKPEPIVYMKIGAELFPSKVEKDVLLRRHSSITQSDDSFHRKSYKGGSSYIKAEYLYTHVKERAENFVKRKERAYFYNYCRPVLDSYSFFLFKANPIRLGDVATENDNLKFIGDPSKGSETLTDLMKRHAHEVMKLGRGWLRMDAPFVPPESLAQEQDDRGSLPYMYLFPAEDMLDWSYESEGTFKWVKFLSRENIKGEFNYTAAQEQNIKIYTKTAVATYSTDGDFIEGHENLVGEVPFIATFLNDEAQSFIADIAIINRALYNWCSLLDEILYKQTFSQLVVPGDSKQRLSEKAVGTSSAFTFDPKSTHAPKFIAPDPEQGVLIQKQIDLAIMEIFRAANLEWIDSKRATNKSGSAKNFDFQNTNKVLGGMAASLEQTETNIFKLFNKFRGKKEAEGVKTQYPRDFSVAALESELTNIFFAISRQISKTFNVYLKKRAVALLAPRLDEKQRNIIEKEIDDAIDELSSLEPGNDEVKLRVDKIVQNAISANVRGSKAKPVQEAVS
ncbi:MAG TPA: hypothetical protein ENI23_16800 [bacterium]|nr:hypothetical protein [bacterium]